MDSDCPSKTWTCVWFVYWNSLHIFQLSETQQKQLVMDPSVRFLLQSSLIDQKCLVFGCLGETGFSWLKNNAVDGLKKVNKIICHSNFEAKILYISLDITHQYLFVHLYTLLCTINLFLYSFSSIVKAVSNSTNSCSSIPTLWHCPQFDLCRKIWTQCQSHVSRFAMQATYVAFSLLSWCCRGQIYGIVFGLEL